MSSLPPQVRRQRLPARSKSGRRAFTLIELILVLTILAIVTAATVPSLRGFGVTRRAADTATLITTMARFGRTKAISEGLVYRLNFDATGGTFWLSYQDAGTYQPAGEYGKPVSLSQGLQMRTDVAPQQDGSVYVQFQPSGRCDPGHVWLTDSLGGTTEVGCESATELYRVYGPNEVTK